MDFESIRDLVSQTFSYFNRKTPGDDQIQLWADELNYIPDETKRHIYNELIKHEKLHQNVPLAIKNIYRQWRQSNPNRTAFKREPCKYCYGSGSICFQIKKFDYLCRCGHCNNWSRLYGESAAAIYTVYKIEELGGLVIETAYDSAYGGLEKRDIKPLLDNLTEDVEKKTYRCRNCHGLHNGGVSCKEYAAAVARSTKEI